MMLLDILYALAFVIALPWVLFMLLTRPAFRAGLKARFKPALETDPGRKTIWLHGSSAGEIDLLRALVEPVESLPGDHRIVISAFSISGYTLARKAFPDHSVIYFPADFSFVVRRFLKAIDPVLIVLVESELWPNFIATVHRAGVPVCVVNARMSEKSYRKHQRIRLIPRALTKLDMIAAQTDEDAERFIELGVDADRLHVTGNMKYDRCDTGDARENAALRRELREQFGIASDMPVLIGGSVHRGEDRVIVSVYKRLIDAGYMLRLVIVPRYPAEAPAVIGELENLGLEGVRKTARTKRTGTVFDDPSRVLVVDTMGELRRFYAMCDIAYVGGSLHYRGSNKGGHNLMEPAVLGAPVLFGPHNYSFRETVRDLLEARGGALVQDEDELFEELARLLDEPESRSHMGERARQVVLENRGAAGHNLELLRDYLPPGELQRDSTTNQGITT